VETVDPQHSNTVALTHGPLALFAIGDLSAKITREQLLAARQAAKGSSDWLVETDTGKVTMRTFPAIKSEKYRLYHNV